MKAYKDYIVTPIGKRYNNSTSVDDKELILNTEIFNHQYVNRLAKVIATPLLFQSPLNVGDEVIVHHNTVLRRIFFAFFHSKIELLCSSLKSCSAVQWVTIHWNELKCSVLYAVCSN